MKTISYFNAKILENLIKDMFISLGMSKESINIIVEALLAPYLRVIDSYGV